MLPLHFRIPTASCEVGENSRLITNLELETVRNGLVKE